MPSIISSVRWISRRCFYVLLLVCLWTAGADAARALPDLVVSHFYTLPADPKAGDTVQFFAELKNLDENSWTPSNVTVTATVRVGGQNVGSIVAQHIDPLDPDHPIPIQIPPTLTYFSEFDGTWTAAEGTHEVCAIVDPANVIPESNEMNNSTCSESMVTITVGPPPRPDLVIEHLSTTPNPAQAGGAVAIWPRIRNVGPVRTPIGVPVDVRVTVDGSTVGTFTVRSGGQPMTLGPQQAYVGRPPQDWFPTGGIYQVCAIADPQGTIPETSEANNIHCVSIAASGPDLEIDHISWSPLRPRAGETVTIEARIHNRGSQATPPGVDVVSAAHVGSTSLGSFRVEDSGGTPLSLGASQRHTGTLSGQWTAVEGTHLICVEADSVHAIAEGSETNNMRCGQVDVAPACTVRLGPEDFGTVHGPMLDASSTLANRIINNGACALRHLIFEPGNYTYNTSSLNGIDLQWHGVVDPSIAGPVSVLVDFEAGDFFFNRELLLSGFADQHNLRIRGAGQDATRLRFCSDPTTCSCQVVSDPKEGFSTSGSCQERAGLGMLHFRGRAQRVVVQDLSLEGVRIDTPPNVRWEFEAGLALCYDGAPLEEEGQAMCRDITVDSVGVKAAEMGIFAKETQGLAVMQSRFEEVREGLLATGKADLEGLLFYGNTIFNQDKALGSKYGLFTTTPVKSSAIVGNTITNVAARGIYPPSETDVLWIHGNTLTNSGTSGSGAGINLGQPDINNVLVSGNVIQGVGDGALPYGLGSMPINDCDEAKIDELEIPNKPARFQSIWPNSPWNGYGISVSGAQEGGVIGLVGNRIFGASSHGIKIMPGSSGVMVYDNEVAGSGVNGLSIVPGYAYHGEFGYTPKSGISDIWVQSNTFNDNARAGIEILPRGTPRFAVPSTCVTPDGCDHAHQPYGLCNSALSNPNPLCVEDYDPDPENDNDPIICESNSDHCTANCFQANWQSYRVDMHGNVTRGNTLANVAINPTRVQGTANDPVEAHYTLSSATADPNDSDNFYLPENGDLGIDSLPSFCVQAPGAPSRTTNEAFNEYPQLLQTIQGLTFTVYDGGVWTQLNPWTDVGANPEDFDVSAPPSCDASAAGGSSGGGEKPGGGSGGEANPSLP